MTQQQEGRAQARSNEKEARQVFVVMGETGEYSDRSEHPVRAFLHETAAQRFAEDCERIAAEWFAAHPDDYYDTENAHPLDPGFRCHYTGTRYYVMKAPLHGSIEP